MSKARPAFNYIFQNDSTIVLVNWIAVDEAGNSFVCPCEILFHN